MISTCPEEYATLSISVDAKEFDEKPYVIPEQPLNTNWDSKVRSMYEQQWMERKAITREMYEFDLSSMVEDHLVLSVFAF